MISLKSAKSHCLISLIAVLSTTGGEVETHSSPPSDSDEQQSASEGNQAIDGAIAVAENRSESNEGAENLELTEKSESEIGNYCGDSNLGDGEVCDGNVIACSGRLIYRLAL